MAFYINVISHPYGARKSTIVREIRDALWEQQNTNGARNLPKTYFTKQANVIYDAIREHLLVDEDPDNNYQEAMHIWPGDSVPS